MLGTAQPAFLERLGANAEGYLGLGFWSRSNPSPRSKAFFEAYRRKFGVTPDDKDTTVAYASAEVIGQAVSKAGLDKAKLRAVLASDQFDTIIGPVKFGANNLNTLLPAGFIQVQSGINEVVFPKEIATAQMQRMR